METIMRFKSFFLTACFLFPLTSPALSIKDLPIKDRTLDAGIPAPEEVIGISIGSRHLFHYEILKYMRSLAEASPRMVSLGVHAKSYGGKDLQSFVISSEKNIANLARIKQNRAEITQAGNSSNFENTPVVVHMMYSIHGNEPSGANLTPLLAYYLTASKDQSLLNQLEDVVLILNPVLNPDGLDRFAAWTNDNRGMTPSADPEDREHREISPNGRTNYYWFDLNRDWLAHQHPESQGRLALFHEWKPNVQLDFHEQGSNSSFFFMPGKPERTYPLTPKINQVLTEKISEFHRKAFDQDGILTFSKEGYDDFYVGKGSTYPDLFGCVGILFEQPSSRGALQNTANGVLAFEETILNQFRASMSSIKASASLKNELLNYQRDFYQSVRRKKTKGHYLATIEGDKTRLVEFVRVLRGHQITVELLAKDAMAGGAEYKAGVTLAIPADQIQSTYLSAIWRRQLNFQEKVFYDVSTWTLPLAFGLTHTTEPVRGLTTEKLSEQLSPQSKELARSSVGYLIDWRDSATPKFLYQLLDTEVKIRVATRPLTADVKKQGVRSFGYGTLFVSPQLTEDFPENALKILESAAQAGVGVYSAESSTTPIGIDLGSRYFRIISKPNVLLVSGAGTNAYRAGEIWHLLDTRVQMPVTRVGLDSLRNIDLSNYTHVLLADPLKSSQEDLVTKIVSFVRSGGIMWVQGDRAIKWLDKQSVSDIIFKESKSARDRSALEKKMKDPHVPVKELEALLPERKSFAASQTDSAHRLVRGAILRGLIDVSHPLGYGFESNELPVLRRNATFVARSKNAYATPLLYADSPLMSGYMSDENQGLAAGSAGILVDSKGEGTIVLSLDIPAFRAHWWGTQKLLLNTIFFGGLIN